MGLASLQVCMDMEPPASDHHYHHHCLQATMHEDQAMMDSSTSPSAGDILGPSQILMSERRLRPPQDQALKCPRCDSTHTKFCYYNNYSLSQPRYFCKTCRRYWTKGGTLRNIPVGGGFRKNRKSSSSSSKKISTNDQPQPLSMSTINSQIIHTQNPNPMNMMLASLTNPADLHLSFHADSINNGYPFSHLPGMVPSGGQTCPINFCLDMNTSKSIDHGYFSTQFGRGGGQFESITNHHGPHVQNLGYAHDLGLGYIGSDDDNNNASAAQIEYSGLHEVKPNQNMLALEWQHQQEQGCSDAKSSKESFGYLGSWSGMMMSSAENHHRHYQILPSTTTSSHSLH